jgi:hypothetical protein
MAGGLEIPLRPNFHGSPLLKGRDRESGNVENSKFVEEKGSPRPKTQDNVINEKEN